MTLVQLPTLSQSTRPALCRRLCLPLCSAAITDKVLEAQRNGTPVYTHAQLRAALGLGEAE